MNGTITTTLRAAYLGPECSFSHQAAVEALPHAKAAPLRSFKTVLEAIQGSGSDTVETFDCALLPIENSTNGSVVLVLDLLAQCGLDPTSSPFPDVEVVDEHYLGIHHCLFVRRAWAEQRLSQDEFDSLPLQMDSMKDDQLEEVPADENGVQGSSAKAIGSILQKLNIKSIHTHPQVWGQCNNTLSTYLPPGNVDWVDMSSTSAGAAWVANTSENDQTNECSAAIASSLAGAKHEQDLICIARNIEDDPESNTTRFLILQNKNKPMVQRRQPSDTAAETHIKSLFTFTTAHDQPGSLAATLAVFARHGFNLSAIQSRPRTKSVEQTRPNVSGTSTPSMARGSSWRYVFFIECFHVSKVNAGSGAGEDEELRLLIEELETVTERVKLLGSWRDRMS